MNTPLRRFVNDLNQMLQQAIVNQGVQLAKGQCATHEEYMRKVGRCDGMQAAGELALDMLRKIELADDDGGLPEMPPAGEGNPGDPPRRQRRGKA